tara:strand:- start:694 stop:843 length:150 start_codon:yes stop_codon:yes gene_type:complete
MNRTQKDLKFVYPDDLKALVIGVMATYVSVVLWDIIKYKYKLLNYKEND